MSDSWRIFATGDEAAMRCAYRALEEIAPAIALMEDGEGWRVDAYLEEKPDLGYAEALVAVAAAGLGLAAPSLALDRIPVTDWLAHVHEGLKPIRAGRFYIHGSHVTEPPPAASLALRLDAATAFGSGEHATTRGCLLALDRLARRLPRPARVLDMGCGSFILGLAAARLWRCPVLGVDIDIESARVANRNAGGNGLGARARALAGDGYRLRQVSGVHDLIFANILARPLMRMAADLRAHLAPGGHAILSGLLLRQANAVLAAHRAQGLKLVARQPQGEWMTLVLKG